MKNEDWHFTSVAPIADRVFHPAEPKALSPDVLASFQLPVLGGPTIAFINGHYSAELSSKFDDAPASRSRAPLMRFNETPVSLSASS
jgi:hypothetical protein